MPKWFAVALLSGALHAAVIRGTVDEKQTGRPLARAQVVLEPVSSTAGESVTARTNLYGSFEFTGLAAGSYLITAARRGFAPVQYGQKRWKAAGLPVVVEQSGSANLTIHLPRFGAISGAVLDENEVGLPEHDVVAYRAARPLQVASHARTDDRGRYRLAGLEPGRYFVRTAARQYEDGGYLPTFYRDTQRVEDGAAVEVELDRETTDINVHPFAGRLLTLSGEVSPAAQINITLVSDTGTQTTLSDSSGNFRFNPTSPGLYELYAQAPADSRLGIQAAYQALTVYGDRSDLRLTLRPLPQVQFVFRDKQGAPLDYHSIRLLARRKDLASTGKTQTLELSGDRLAFLPGRWELALAPVPGYFVSSFSAARAQAGEGPRADGWNELLINGAVDQAQFVLSPAGGGVHGRVLGPGHEPAAGAPVYLEAYESASRRLKEVQVTRADAQGRYRFADLAPGTYRLLSSFDFDASDGSIESSGGKSLRVDEARDLIQDLDLF